MKLLRYASGKIVLCTYVNPFVIYKYIVAAAAAAKLFQSCSAP